jgi:thioredoxin:protein disulfide reductase
MSPLPIRHIPALTLVILCGTALAQSSPSAGQSAAAQQGGIDAVLKAAKGSPNDPLPVDQAFRLDAMAQGSDRVRLNWEIAEGDYLYRSRIKITTSSTSAQLGTPQFPAGQIKNDEYFGRQEIYHHELSVIVPIARGRSGALSLPLQVTYQGCSEPAGICYPPVTKQITLNLTAAANAPGRGATEAADLRREMSAGSGNAPAPHAP